MINFSSIHQKIVSIDYGFNKPTSLITLAPIVSLVVLKMQKAHLYTVIQHSFKLDTVSECVSLLSNPNSKKIDTINQWHLAGALIQAIVLFSLSHFNPLIGFIGFISLYEATISARGIAYEEISKTPNGASVTK